MRANDAFRGMVSDVFSFTFLQEFMARQLGVGLGDYHHNVGSIHVYETDDAWTERVLAEAEDSEPPASLRFPEMPAGDNWEQLREILEYERPLRENRLRLTPEHLERSGLSDYWKQVVLLFGLYRGIAHDDAFERGLYERLWSVYRYLVANKWAPELREETVGGQTPRGGKR
jgi:thymidylate synthase